MKYVLILAYYLVSLGGEGSDVHMKVYPDTFETAEKCKFMRDVVRDEAEKAYGKNGYVANCYGVGP